MQIKDLTTDDITLDMLLNFNHRQIITKQWVKCNNTWELTETSSIREWNKEKRIWIPKYLCQQIERGGAAVAAFDSDTFIGFCCMDGGLAGEGAKYANMTMLFVDDNWKRKGVGKKLFSRICMHAAEMKADKLFISAVPSFETIAFYFSMGCQDTQELIEEYMDTEYDRYLEYSLPESI